MVVNITNADPVKFQVPRELISPASSNKFSLPHITSQFLWLVFPDFLRCSHDSSLALSRCSSAHWLFVLALSLLPCPFGNLACILSPCFISCFVWHPHTPTRFLPARLFMIF